MGSYSGFQRGSNYISLLFADDILLFSKATASQVRLVGETLNLFCRASGLKVNVVKSRAMCSPFVSRQRRDLFTSISSIRFASDLGKYMGFPLLISRPKKNDFSFIVDKLRHRLASWKGKLLNKVGRLILAKLVLFSISIYSMQTFRLPTSICDDVDKTTRSFIWSKNNMDRGLHLINWETVIASLSTGGLGLRKARQVNTSLLGKLVWGLLHEKNKLCVQILTHKYLGQANVFNAVCSVSSSPIWKAISKTAVELKDGFRIRIGDGSSSLWYDEWIKDGSICSLVDYVYVSDSNFLVKDCWSNGVWNFNYLYTPLTQSIKSKIEEVLVTIFSEIADCWVWVGSLSGVYSASSCYNWFHSSSDSGESWKWIWRIHAPFKVSFLVWLAIHQSLPKNLLRTQRHLATSEICPRCGSAPVSVIHCLRDCQFAKEMWWMLGFHLDL